MRRGRVTVRRRVGRWTLPVAGALALPGTATAHAGGSSAGRRHLVADVFGFIAFAFLAYIAVAFARRVAYPRLRDALR